MTDERGEAIGSELEPHLPAAGLAGDSLEEGTPPCDEPLVERRVDRIHEREDDGLGRVRVEVSPGPRVREESNEKPDAGAVNFPPRHAAEEPAAATNPSLKAD